MARSKSTQVTLGAVLLAVGGVLLAARFVVLEAAPLWMLGLGAALAVAAILRRHYATLVGGAVLLGLGAGFVLGDRGVAGLGMASWLLTGLAAGFLGLFAIARLLRLGRSAWPAVTAAVLLAVVAARHLREFVLLPPALVIAVRTWWPAGLVLVGLILLYRGFRR